MGEGFVVVVGEPRMARISVQPAELEGDLTLVDNAMGLILFAHGSGSSRHSPRNRYVAKALQQSGFATLLLDLLTAEEEAEERDAGENRFDIELLTARLIGAMDWIMTENDTRGLPVGLFGASTGAAAALAAAA